LVRLTPQARQALRDDEVLVLDWHRIPTCCATVGDISVHPVPRARIESSRTFRPAAGEPAGPVYVHRMAMPHLAGRDVVVDCRRRFGVRQFVCDLPADFGLRSILGRLPAPTVKENVP